MFLYGLQNLDKTTLSYTSIMMIIADVDITSYQYGWPVGRRYLLRSEPRPRTPAQSPPAELVCDQMPLHQHYSLGEGYDLHDGVPQLCRVDDRSPLISVF